MAALFRMEASEYIRQHHDINYCEAIMMQDGSIVDAIPSHQIALAKLSVINLDTIPRIASPVDYIISKNHWISIWYEFIIYTDINEEQMIALKRLQDSGTISPDCYCIHTDEYERVTYILNAEYNNIEERKPNISLKKLLELEMK